MKKLLFVVLAVASTLSLAAQDSTEVKKTKEKTDWSKVKLTNRSNDHFMLQLGYNGWSGIPDTINAGGISRSFNAYFMFDLPFKTDPRFSVGIGAGVGTDNFFLNKTTVDIRGQYNNELSFKNVADTNNYKKYKIATAYLEAPIELRFQADPTKKNSFKAAIGGKVGTLVSASSKGKTLRNKNGGTILNGTVQEHSKRFFNGTRLQVTGRVGWGAFSLYGSYQFNAFIKEGSGPDIRPFQIGINISGL
ncbi:outer membrane beta-barrel protein [Gynurincola endophyticus]|jgi:hypothetical protein|uniref:outer membrane beta-barrel protein n=1 Tax=Gynurincola endophyticus TaxID=2479004 RepID=UPI000F8D69CC|nr:outer membrane beta-barrel protein [Gynurincola endophyticus]